MGRNDRGPWAVSSAAWLVVGILRIVRFHRMGRRACHPRDTWQREVAELAARLNLRRWPELRITEGVISPLLWAVGPRPLIILPRTLVEGLDAVDRRALIAHELAHYYRRDHWVRLFEMLVLAIYWWHPVAWWAQRELQRAEELGCDAWAVWLLDDAHAYGRGLFATIDFLSERPRSSPLGASAMGRFRNMQRRFEMILSHPVRVLSWRNWLAIAIVAIFVLPWSACMVSGSATEWARLSPFTDVTIQGDKVQVEFEGAPTN